jgi:hypothetical protein
MWSKVCTHKLTWFVGVRVQPARLVHGGSTVRHWAGNCRQQLLHAGATVQNTYVQCFRTAPLGEESRPHPYLRAELRIPHSLVLSMARFRLSSHNWGVEFGRHQGVVWFARGCKRCAALGMHDLPVDDEAHLFFRAQLPLWLSGSVDLHNCHFCRCRISCAVVMCTGWHCLCTSA